MIYDSKKEKWYEFERNWRGNLVLREIIFEEIHKAPIKGDYVFSDDGFKAVKIPKEPKTPQ